ncbi:RNA methyltransferase [Neopusillimonas maritima]|jgi:TrmH family RNA methyltransferase|uniref:RNA methyltransferase n=1 Tax=Neopusillimonas maritima TaxID=2026239 RepID=A0ABX9MTC3_9BURK|nr:RNA methyltransferase [Neopusillimonas maritima]RII82199.1 RNA methyltransferase [Neopusillimonas maritima]|tara:strand:+ start:126035 stop:126814 length:780 start_codon:yes stop_codon:yes gene_type:complete
MKQIESRDNALFKSFVRAANGKSRNQAWLEGVHLCQAWLQHGATPPQFAVFDTSRVDQSVEIQALYRAVPDQSKVLLASGLMKKLDQVEKGQGVGFIVAPPAAVIPEHIKETVLWLDRVQDPGNMGTLFRTAAAAGVGSVYCSTGCAAAWSPKVLRSAQGAHFSLTIHENCDLQALFNRLEVPLAAMTLQGSVSLYQAKLPHHIAWLAGNEGQGILPALEAIAQLKVYIPQASDIESLNVAAATAICLFEHRRRFLSGE